MERTIKFKAKRLDNDEWVEGDLTQTKEGKAFIHIVTTFFSSICAVYQVDPSTVCQFTGLKDKEGKDVWEYDIIQDSSLMVRTVVKWDKFICCFSPYGIATSLGSLIENQNWTVIGNKFDRKKGEK